MKRTLACFLALSLLLCLFPAAVFAAGTQSITSSVISRGLTLTSEHAVLSSGALRRAFTLDYVPDSGTSPIVLYGNKLYGKSSVDEVVAFAQKQGYTVMAAVNADFFNLETGLPTGMCIQNGRLVSSDAAWNAVGFRADGTALVGAPQLSLSLTLPNGMTVPIYALNKVRSDKGIYLYSSDFSTSTKTGSRGTEVMIRLSEGETLGIGKTVTGTVTAVAAQTNTALPDGCLVLSLAEANTAGLSLASVTAGATLSITASAAPGWESVVWSTGGGNLLAKDGALTAQATAGDDPRTVLGVRADGSFSVMVCDGRQSTLSAGISTREAAQQLLDKGCVTVINLDGGGSSAMSARWPGQSASALQNSPSDGAERRCATYIFFVNKGDSTLPASRATVYPRSAALLAGASMAISALTCNADYFPTGTYSDLYDITEGEGYIVGNVLTAPAFDSTIKVAADATGLQSDPAVYTVVSAPSAMRLVRSGGSTPITSLALSPNETINLDVWATDGLQRLISQDSQFSFALSPAGLGTVDPDGILTAGSASGVSGKLTVTFGAKSVSIPVTVGSAPQVLADFENSAAWTVVAEPTASASAVINTAVENSRYGHNSLHVAASGTGGAAYFVPPAPLTIPAGAQTLSLLVRGSGRYTLNFHKADGTVVTAAFTAQGDAWSYQSAAIPAGAVSLSSIAAEPTDGKLSHEAWLDQLTVHFGPAADDVKPPVLDIQPFDGLVLTVMVSDNYAFPVEKNMISVRLDGKALDFAYDADTGELVCQVPQSAGLHRITVAAQDYFLNYTRQSTVFGATDAYTYGDLKNHWCADYAEFLRIQGLFMDADKFNPETKVTNAMAATLISRYLGIDTAKYANVELPYTDAAAIPDWALPHVKAMYALSIMTGTIHNGQRMLLPNESCTRAQIMTILGRTFGRGFSYPQAQFSDFQTAPAWAQDHISLLSSLGIVSGYGGPTGEVRPLNTITRAEFASLLFKMY